MRSKWLRFLVGMLAGCALTFGALALLERSGMGEDERAMAVRMRAFVRALSEAPVNESPASQWSPLLKRTGTVGDSSFSCSVCHGAEGERYDRAIEDGHLGQSAGESSGSPAESMSREQMVTLMEDWVEQLNHEADHLLRKAVVCTDCHERDPRRE